MKADKSRLDQTLGHDSPEASPPSLVNSTSLSSESTSPPLPSTPPPPGPVRGRSRYGELVPQGHVPLHRRGTSNRYENFEDLLREAGYRETRIFTPDHPSRKDGTDSAKGSIRGGVGAVVDFLSHFVPSAAASRSSSQVAREQVSPTSPLTNPSPASMENHSSRSTSDLSTLSSESATSEPTPRPTPSRRRNNDMIKSYSTPQSATLRPPEGYPSHPYFAHGSRRPHESSHYGNLPSDKVDSAPSPLRRRYSNAPTSQGIAGPSHASAYLRHISSVPSMQRNKSQPTPARRVHPMYVSTVDVDMDGIKGRGNGEGEEEAPPPLPKGWIESVARAVLYGPTAGPSRLRDSSPVNAHSMQPNPPFPNSSENKSSSRIGLFDQTNLAAPDAYTSGSSRPNLLARVSSTKSRRSESVVSHTRVMCRSAPVSRNGSRVRSRSGGRKKESRKHKRAKGLQERFRGRKARKDEEFMPSLSRTKVEGDEWLRRGRKRNSLTAHSPWIEGEAGNDESVFSDSPSGTSTEEDDGEPDLARILVPPKRQNSIRSLRRHLPLTSSAPNATSSLLSISRATSKQQLKGSSLRRTTPPQVDSDIEDEYIQRSDKRNSHGEQPDYFTFASTSRQSAKRKSIPPAWSQGHIAAEETQ
ncbi:hypothetical protein DL96DRAFT_99193 [Flagelloscypha sp. PMI_526]|nr:hypothetical protein DL96DRAFT_99193 [Flagelloscypha sp. PMI_526]